MTAMKAATNEEMSHYENENWYKMVSPLGVNNSIQKNIKICLPNFPWRGTDNSMVWSHFVTHITVGKKKVRSEANFLSTVTDVECLQPTVKLKFVAV